MVIDKVKDWCKGENLWQIRWNTSVRKYIGDGLTAEVKDCSKRVNWWRQKKFGGSVGGDFDVSRGQIESITWNWPDVKVTRGDGKDAKPKATSTLPQDRKWGGIRNGDLEDAECQGVGGTRAEMADMNFFSFWFTIYLLHVFKYLKKVKQNGQCAKRLINFVTKHWKKGMKHIDRRWINIHCAETFFFLIPKVSGDK